MRCIPWSWVKSWRCVGCGQCCNRFAIPLRTYEYASMTKHFGHGMTETDNLGNPCVRKVRGRCVFQDDEGLCNAQRLGLKPLACKLWPFMVFKEPRRRFEAEASFRHQGRESFVYVDTAFPCNGLNKGNPEELPLILAEAVEVARDQGRAQHHTTASTGSGPSAR